MTKKIGWPAGPLALRHCSYMRARKNSETGRWRDDAIALVYRDSSGKKDVLVVSSPTYIWYAQKHEKWLDMPRPYVSFDDVWEMESPARHVLRDAAAYLDGKDGVSLEIYNRLSSSEEPWRVKRFHLSANLHGTDFNLVDHWISRFLDRYPPEELQVSPVKMFYDIEVDLGGYPGFPDPEEAPCPVNVVTMMLDDGGPSVKAWMLVLDDPSNASMQAWLPGSEAALSARFSAELGRPCEFRVEAFAEEEGLIRRFFGVVNEEEPDVSMAWNSRFDLVTMLRRLEVLGANPEEVVTWPKMRDKGFSYKPWYKVDDRTPDVADKGEWLEAASCCVWTDQLLLFAQIRKGLGKRDSMALDAIAEDELGVRKDSLGSDGLREMPLRDWGKFAEYNAQDVALLVRLEARNRDADQVHDIGITTRTRVESAMKKTTCLRNLARHLYEKAGYCMSNNRNAFHKDGKRGGTAADARKEKADREKFKGALVLDPTLNEPLGELVGGERSRFVFSDVADMDLASLYPSIILAWNIDPSTQYGKLVLPPEGAGDDWEEDADAREEAAALCDELASGDWLAVGAKWLGLPSIEQIDAAINAAKNDEEED